jgi:hypothetical protein
MVLPTNTTRSAEAVCPSSAITGQKGRGTQTDRALLLQQAHDLERRALAQVVDVLLVGDPQHQDAAPRTGLRLVVQRVRHLLHHERGISALISLASSIMRVLKASVRIFHER